MALGEHECRLQPKLTAKAFRRIYPSPFGVPGVSIEFPFQVIAESITDVFEKMFFADVTVEPNGLGPTDSSEEYTSIATIGLGSADTKAGLNMFFPRESANHVLELMGGDEGDAALLADGLGELCNLIAGGIKKRMQDRTNEEYTLTLPAVITGNSIHSCWKSTAQLERFRFVIDEDFPVDGVLAVSHDMTIHDVNPFKSQSQL